MYYILTREFVKKYTIFMNINKKHKLTVIVFYLSGLISETT